MCKAADLNQWPVREKGICTDASQTAQQLQMAVRKSLETFSGIFLNQLQPKFAQLCSQICSKWNAVFERLALAGLALLLQSSIWRFLSNLLLKIVIYCVTDQSSITWSGKCYLNFNFSALIFLRSTSCWAAGWWALGKNCAKRKNSTLIFVQCNNMYL